MFKELTSLYSSGMFPRSEGVLNFIVSWLYLNVFYVHLILFENIMIIFAKYKNIIHYRWAKAVKYFKNFYQYKTYKFIWCTVIELFALRKKPWFHLISCCGNFVEKHLFRIVSGESPETTRKVYLSIKFPYQEIRWNYGIFCFTDFKKSSNLLFLSLVTIVKDLSWILLIRLSLILLTSRLKVSN